MERQFGFGFPFGGFGSPFFFLSPFFFPFFFPFFRGEGERNGAYYTQHECQEGDTMRKLAKRYNVPQPILEAMNPHVQNPTTLTPGENVYIPRMDKMYCQTMYMEQETAGAHMPYPMHPNQQMMPPTYMPSTPYPGGPQGMPYPGTPHRTEHSQSYES